jgi:hypothetical protein
MEFVVLFLVEETVKEPPKKGKEQALNLGTDST